MPKLENTEMLNKLLEISVANYYFYTKDGMEYYSGTLSSHQLTNNAGDGEDARGGVNNDCYYTINKANDLSLETTDIYNSQYLDAIRFGNGMNEVGSSRVRAKHMPKNYTIKSEEVIEHYERCNSGDSGALEVIDSGSPISGQVLKSDVITTIPDINTGEYVKKIEAGTRLYVELINTPIEGEEVVAYNNKTKKKIESTKFVQDGTNKKKFIVTEDGLLEGDDIFVTGFDFFADSKDMYVSISSMGKSTTGTLVVEIPLFDSDTMEIVKYKQFIFHKAQLLAKDASSTGQSERKTVEAKNTFKITKDLTKKDLGTIVYLSPEESITEQA